MSARLSLGFACLAHMFSHMFGPIFFLVAAGVLAGDLGLSHGEAVALILAGNILFGLAAPLAGWIGDRWRATALIGLCFLGMGAGMVGTGLSSTPLGIAAFLGVTGLFASIYHPVGISWLIRNAASRGTALGINGIFGGIGPAVATLLAGILVDLWSWQAAFIVPGAAMILVGVVFFWLVWRGTIVERADDRRPDPPASRRDTVRVYLVLAVTMVCGGIIFQATQPALPELFLERLDGSSDGVLGISMALATVYALAGTAQMAGGFLVDRFSVKTVYLAAIVSQVPFLFLAGILGGPGLLAVAAIMMCANQSSLPAENVLIARYTPSHWRGFAFGLKFILIFGLSGGVGVALEGAVYDFTGGFFWVFTILAGVGVATALAALLLPNEPAPVVTE
jgi:MFS transporter, FSR family, fosmidomycin resistance protein